VELSSRAFSKLLAAVGTDDFDRLTNELEKLSLFAASRRRIVIEPEDVDQLVDSKASESIFKFLDFITQKNRKQAYFALNKLLACGQNELYILTMLQYQFRNFYLIKEFSNKKVSEQEMAKELRIHPFVIKKSRMIIHKLSYQFLAKALFSLQDLETKIKRGKVEPRLGLLLLINEVT
jgi:DNA polymerase-3 subunit delta